MEIEDSQLTQDITSGQPQGPSDSETHVDEFIDQFFSKTVKPKNKLPSFTDNNRKKTMEDTSPSAIMEKFGQRLDNFEDMLYAILDGKELKLPADNNTRTARNMMDFSEQNDDNNLAIPLGNLSSDQRTSINTQKDKFYNIYGKLKSEKNSHSKEELATKLSPEDFVRFKSMRSTITKWLKTGLAINRHLDLLNVKSDLSILPPLLSIGIYAAKFKSSYLKLISEQETQKRLFSINVMMEANSLLKDLNIEVENYLTLIPVSNNMSIIIAKAFKTASFAGSYLFKNGAYKINVADSGEDISAQTLHRENTDRSENRHQQQISIRHSHTLPQNNYTAGNRHLESETVETISTSHMDQEPTRTLKNLHQDISSNLSTHRRPLTSQPGKLRDDRRWKPYRSASTSRAPRNNSSDYISQGSSSHLLNLPSQPQRSSQAEQSTSLLEPHSGRS